MHTIPKRTFVPLVLVALCAACANRTNVLDRYEIRNPGTARSSITVYFQGWDALGLSDPVALDRETKTLARMDRAALARVLESLALERERVDVGFPKYDPSPEEKREIFEWFQGLGFRSVRLNPEDNPELPRDNSWVPENSEPGRVRPASRTFFDDGNSR